MKQHLSQRLFFIDSSEQYGAHVIESFIKSMNPITTALDLGAGSGRDLGIVQNVFPNAQCLAIDCDNENTKLLQQKSFTVFKSNLEMDILPFDNESIDLIIVNQVYEHIKEIFWVTHEISRVLKVGGQLILGVPNVASLHNRLALLFGQHPTQAKSASAHIRIFSKPDTLRFFSAVAPNVYTLKGFKGSQFYPFPRTMARFFANIFPQSAFSIFFHFQKENVYANQCLDFLAENPLETLFYQGDR